MNRRLLGQSYDQAVSGRGYPLLSNPVLSQDSAEWRATAERQQLNLLPDVQSKTPSLVLTE